MSENTMPENHMPENDFHGSHHDFPENNCRQPVQPNNPDPLFAFPPEFPYPDPGYAGPFIVINQIESPSMPDDTPGSEHDTSHPLDLQDHDSPEAGEISFHSCHPPVGAPDEENYYL